MSAKRVLALIVTTSAVTSLFVAVFFEGFMSLTTAICVLFLSLVLIGCSLVAAFNQKLMSKLTGIFRMPNSTQLLSAEQVLIRKELEQLRKEMALLEVLNSGLSDHAGRLQQLNSLQKETARAVVALADTLDSKFWPVNSLQKDEHV